MRAALRGLRCNALLGVRRWRGRVIENSQCPQTLLPQALVLVDAAPLSSALAGSSWYRNIRPHLHATPSLQQ
jgi:hypothetical protein